MARFRFHLIRIQRATDIMCCCEEYQKFNPYKYETLSGAQKWEVGTVIKTWDQGNPYRIEIDGSGKNVWGPEDRDICVRAAEA